MKRPRPIVACLLALISTLVVVPAARFLGPSLASGQDRAPQAGDEEDLLEASGGDDDVGDVESDVRSEGAGKVKVFRFSGLGLDARLKSPQLLYFLNRLRAEFDRPRLPHRTFIPELQRSTKSGTF